MKAFTSGSDEEQLEQIITQKWLAVYPNGNEGWAEVRVLIILAICCCHVMVITLTVK